MIRLKTEPYKRRRSRKPTGPQTRSVSPPASSSSSSSASCSEASLASGNVSSPALKRARFSDDSPTHTSSNAGSTTSPGGCGTDTTPPPTGGDGGATHSELCDDSIESDTKCKSVVSESFPSAKFVKFIY